MIDIPPGLLCGNCEQPLYPETARSTDYGWMHAGHCPSTCAIDGCEQPRDARGWCQNHWKQWRKHGHPLATRAIELEDVEWMAETGESFYGAAMRLGVKPGSLEKFLCGKQRQDLLRAMRGLEAVA
jgi:hypothetical protein